MKKGWAKSKESAQRKLHNCLSWDCPSWKGVNTDGMQEALTFWLHWKHSTNSFCPEKQWPSNKDSGNQVQRKQRRKVALNQEQLSPHNNGENTLTRKQFCRGGLWRAIWICISPTLVLMKATPHVRTQENDCYQLADWNNFPLLGKKKDAAKLEQVSKRHQ